MKYIGIKGWKEFKKTEKFVTVAKLIRERLAFYEAEFL